MAEDGYAGFAKPNDHQGGMNEMDFVFRQFMNRTATVMPVKVIASYPGGVGKVGTVDVKPMVQMISGDGIVQEHGIIYGIPVIRVQGGNAALIVDPVVGDTGLILVCSHDISSVKKTGQEAPPTSYRRFNYSDGIYLGGIMGAAPTNFVQVNSSGVTMTAGATVVALTSSAVNIISSVLTHNGVNIGSTHKHGGVQAGGSTTSVPQ